MKRFYATILITSLIIVQSSFAQTYSFSELGTLGGLSGQGRGISNTGIVTGVTTDSGGATLGFITVNGIVTNVGISDFVVEGEAVNSSGQAVITSVSGGGVMSGYYYQGGIATMLPTFGGTTTAPFAINNAGVIAGYATNSSGVTDVFTYTIGSSVSLTNLGHPSGSVLGGNFGVKDINSSNSIVGYYANSSGFNQAFVYNSGIFTNLGTLGGNASVAYAINNTGVIVGVALNSGGNARAFRYSGSTMTDLGTLGGATSFARDINSSGVIVGTSMTSGGVQHAFVYSGGVMTDLNNLVSSGFGITLTDAVGINDFGQILVNGTNSGGIGRAYILSLIPEPSTYALIILGLIFTYSTNRRRSLALLPR